MYKLIKHYESNEILMVLHTDSNTFIPFNKQLSEYQAYLAWLAEGNTPEPADPVPAPTYQALRAAAYPSVGDQLDAMWKGGEAEAEMLATVLAVKAEYPKP